MRHNPRGRTGLFVSGPCPGTMTFGDAGFVEHMGGLEHATTAFGPIGEGPNQRALSRTHLIAARYRRDQLGQRPARRVMIEYLAAALVLLPSPVAAQPVQPGAWDVTSTVVDLTVPGVPGFMRRMIKGKSKAEHKRLAAGQGIEALLAPDPKAQCHIDDQRIADGHYAQSLSCPQKQGGTMHIARVGTYDGDGFAGRATVSDTTGKGPIMIVLDQHARRVAA